MSREVAGAPTHSGELYRARGAYRARLSASTGYGMARWSCWCLRMGGRRTELAGEKLRASAAMVRGGAAAVAREQRGTSGSGDGGGRARAHLVAD